MGRLVPFQKHHAKYPGICWIRFFPQVWIELMNRGRRFVRLEVDIILIDIFQTLHAAKSQKDKPAQQYVSFSH